MWIWEPALLLALPVFVQGKDIRECFTDETINSLPPSVAQPAEQLRQLLEEHRFLTDLNDEYEVNEETVITLERLVSYTHNVIHETIQSLGGLPTPQTVEELPSSLLLALCLSRASISESKGNKPLIDFYTDLYSLDMKPSSCQFYIRSKQLDSQMEVIPSVTQAVAEYWMEAPRPLTSLKDTWLVPYATIALKIQPLCEVATKDRGKLECGLRAMSDGELQDFKKSVQEAIAEMEEAFAKLRKHMDNEPTLERGDQLALKRTLRLKVDWNSKCYAQAPTDDTALVEYISPPADGESQPRQVAILLRRLLADYALQNMFLDFSLPREWLRRDSLSDWYGEFLSSLSSSCSTSGSTSSSTSSKDLGSDLDESLIGFEQDEPTNSISSSTPNRDSGPYLKEPLMGLEQHESTSSASSSTSGSTSSKALSLDPEESSGDQRRWRFEPLEDIHIEIVGACQAILDCHTAHPGNFAALQDVLSGLQVDVRCGKAVSDLMRRARAARDWSARQLDPEEAPNCMDEYRAKDWDKLVAIFRAVDKVFDLAINYSDSDQRNELILRLLVEGGPQLRWLLPRIRALMFVIEHQTLIPEGSRYNWNESPIACHVGAMRQRQPTKSARKSIAVAADGDQAACPEPQDDMSAPGAKAEGTLDSAPGSADGKLQEDSASPSGSVTERE